MLNRRYDGYQTDLVSMVYKFFDKNSKGSGFKSAIKPNKELEEELSKIIIRKFERRKIYLSKTIFGTLILINKKT